MKKIKNKKLKMKNTLCLCAFVAGKQ